MSIENRLIGNRPAGHGQESGSDDSFRKIHLSENSTNSLKGEHLRPDVRPVIAALLNWRFYKEGASADGIRRIKEKGLFVNSKVATSEAAEMGMIGKGADTYVISEFDERDKRTNPLINCTSLVVIGRDADSVERSFMTHQNPDYFLKHREEFSADLRNMIRRSITMSESGTRDVLIFGGQGYQGYHAAYLDSIRMLGDICTEEFGFEPVVITGPNRNKQYHTTAFFSTQDRRLYLVRPQQYKDSNYDGRFDKSFVPSKIEEQGFVGDDSFIWKNDDSL